MEEKKPRVGRYRLGSAFLWAAAQGAVAWFQEPGVFSTLGAALGGAIAGWGTASLLGWFARFGAGAKVMMISGLVLGVGIASGAVVGVGYAISHLRPGEVKVDWDTLGRSFTSGAAIPAAVLGVVTGLFVRAKFPRPKEPE